MILYRDARKPTSAPPHRVRRAAARRGGAGRVQPGQPRGRVPAPRDRHRHGARGRAAAAGPSARWCSASRSACSARCCRSRSGSAWPSLSQEPVPRLHPAASPRLREHVPGRALRLAGGLIGAATPDPRRGAARAPRHRRAAGRRDPHRRARPRRRAAPPACCPAAAAARAPRWRSCPCATWPAPPRRTLMSAARDRARWSTIVVALAGRDGLLRRHAVGQPAARRSPARRTALTADLAAPAARRLGRRSADRRREARVGATPGRRCASRPR